MPKADTENQLLPETTNDNNNKCNICYAFGGNRAKCSFTGFGF